MKRKATIPEIRIVSAHVDRFNGKHVFHGSGGDTMTQRTDTADTISMLARGEATFTLLGEPDPQVAFLIRERSAIINYLGETAVEVRSGLFPVGQIAVTAVIFRVGQYVMQEYVTWWNYHKAGNAEVFQAMAGQEYLSFHFYGDSIRSERTFVAANPLREFFATAIDTILRLPVWSEKDFLVARQKVCGLFPSPQVMWDAAAITP
jgi:hypothetical protein